MRTRTVIKYTRNLTTDEYSQCYKKNFGSGGWMRDDLQIHKADRASTSKVVLIKDERGKILAWALTQPEGKRKRANAMFWVVPTYRRKGYGTRLVYHVRKIDAKPKVFPHDEASGKFFAKHRPVIRTAQHDRFWLNS